MTGREHRDTTRAIDAATGGRRLRRLRQNEWSRRLVRETRLAPADLIWPIFVRDGDGAPEPVASMPGVHRHSAVSYTHLTLPTSDLV